METNEETTELQSLVPASEENQGNSTISYFQKFKGILAIFGTVIVMFSSTTAVQLLERKIPDFELNTLRSITFYFATALGFIIMRKLPVVPKSEILSTLCLGILCFVETTLIYVSVTFISLASAESIRMTSGIASGIIVFSLFWEEKITVKRVIFAFLCIFGVILVTQPEFIFTGKQHLRTNCTNHIKLNYTIINESMETTKETIATTECKENSIVTIAIGYILSFSSGCFLSGDTLLLKRHPYLSEHLFEVLFWVNSLAVTISVVAMAIFESPTLPANWYEFLLVAVHSVAYVFGWPLWIYGLKYISGNTANIIASTSVVFVLIPQYTILSDILPGNRNWIEVAGVVLILLGSSLGSVWELLKCE